MVTELCEHEDRLSECRHRCFWKGHPQDRGGSEVLAIELGDLRWMYELSKRSRKRPDGVTKRQTFLTASPRLSSIRIVGVASIEIFKFGLFMHFDRIRRQAIFQSAIFQTAIRPAFFP